MLFVQSREALPFLYSLLFFETLVLGAVRTRPQLRYPEHHPIEEETLVANGLVVHDVELQPRRWLRYWRLSRRCSDETPCSSSIALSFVASALVFRGMTFREPHLENVARFRASDLFDFSPIAEGFRYVRRDPRLLATMFVKAGLGFMGANWVLLPIFGERIYPVHIGPSTRNRRACSA